MAPDFRHRKPQVDLRYSQVFSEQGHIWYHGLDKEPEQELLKMKLKHQNIGQLASPVEPETTLLA